jgi:hypothetical protein
MTITFNFLDATNLVAAQPGHMGLLVVTLVDANHHTEDWEFTGGTTASRCTRFSICNARTRSRKIRGRGRPRHTTDIRGEVYGHRRNYSGSRCRHCGDFHCCAASKLV